MGAGASQANFADGIRALDGKTTGEAHAREGSPTW